MKWKYLRDEYVRHYRQNPKRSRWRHSTRMEFLEALLQPNLNMKVDNGNSDSNSGDVEQPSETTATDWSQSVNNLKVEGNVTASANGLSEAEIENENNDEETDVSSVPSVTGRRLNRRKSATKRPLASSDPLEVADKQYLKARQRPDISTDEDELFLLSLLPALKRLTPAAKALTKIRFQQVLYDMEFKVRVE
jgi:hypothetical protein